MLPLFRQILAILASALIFTPLAYAQQGYWAADDVAIGYYANAKASDGSPVSLKATTSLGGWQMWRLYFPKPDGEDTEAGTGNFWNIDTQPEVKANPKPPPAAQVQAQLKAWQCNVFAGPNFGTPDDEVYNGLHQLGYQREGRFARVLEAKPFQYNLWVSPSHDFLFEAVMPEKKKACIVFWGTGWVHNFERIARP